LITEAGFFKEF